MTTQKKLPFDKRQYARRLESIEMMNSKLITKGQLKCVKRFCSFLFSYEKSSFEGDLTLIASDEDDPHTRTILQRCQISVKTLANWIAWGKALGVVRTSIDCDGYRTRRTTLSIIWSRVTELSTVAQAARLQVTDQVQGARMDEQGSLRFDPEMPLKEPDKMQPLHFAQNATVSRQNATVARQNATVAFCLIEDNLTKSQHSQGVELGRECGSDFEKNKAVKAQLKALGVLDRRCVDRALARGAPIDAIEAVVRSAGEVDPPPDPRVIWGRVGSLADDPEMAQAPWPHTIARVQRLRRMDREHEQAKLRRRAATEAAGETELTASLVELLADSSEIEQLQRWHELSDDERSSWIAEAKRSNPMLASRPDDSQIVIDFAMMLSAGKP